MISNNDFWDKIHEIILNDFTPKGLETLDYYADLFISGQCAFKRFSPQEQYGCAAGGSTHVIASILSGAKIISDSANEELSDIQREFKQAEKQTEIIESWARRVGVWFSDTDKLLTDSFGCEISEGGEAKVYDNGVSLVKSIGLDYFILPLYALDRISLHNAYFPETSMQVIGFGRNSFNEFKIIVEQPFIEGSALSEEEISNFVGKLGFELKNSKNWTYATPEIYLSDMHDENLIKSKNGNIFVIDCDIRINTPELKQGGIRHYSTEIVSINLGPVS